MKNWLEMYLEKIKQKYHVEKTEVKTYNDFIKLLESRVLKKAN
jgi:hypothetical protein